MMNPRTSDAIVSIDKLSISFAEDGLTPLTDMVAKEREILKATIPRISSSATTGKIVLVRGPYARYCLMTRSVAAGAVAIDIDAITILKAKSMLKIKYMTMKTTLIADRKSTRLNSSHVAISYAVFCLKKKKKIYS